MNSLEALLVWHEVVEEPRLICNRDGKVMWINSAARNHAERELFTQSPNFASYSSWQSTLAADVLTQILESATKVPRNRTVKIQVDTASSKLKEVRIVPFTSELNDLIGVTIPAAKRLDPASLAALKSEFGVTKAEFKILSDIFDGLSPSETAEGTGTSIFTVKTHIRNIYRKLNVSNRSSLMSKLSQYN